jgi:hypothetical protein
MASTTRHEGDDSGSATASKLEGHVTSPVPGSGDEAFRLITDVGRLPEWNATITRVAQVPVRLAPGIEWVVELSALGRSWRSRSRVLSLDAHERRFVYRSCTDDGNPSYGDWSWSIDPAEDGAQVHVSWALHPQTFWRQRLLGPMRNHMLRREVAASVQALAGLLSATSVVER